MSIEGAMSTTTPASGSDDILARIEASLSPADPKAPVDPTDPVDPVDPQDPEDPVDPADPVDPEDPKDPVDPEDPKDPDDEISLEVSQFAKLLGVDEDSLIVDEDGTVSFRTKVDGEIGKAKIRDLIRSHQTDAHVTRKSQALSEEKKAFEAQVQQKAQEIQSRITEVSAAVQMLEGQLTQEYQSIDWAGLKQSDPARWSVLRQEFTDRVAQLNAAKQKAFQVLQTQTQEQQQQMETAREARLQQEADALRTKLPEWNDPEVAKVQHAAMSEFLASNYGFDPQDINGVEDHRLILLAQDAMKYRAGLKAGQEAVKKVVSLPKLQKPGAQRVNAEAQAKKAIQEKKLVRLRKSGGSSTAALADLLESRL